MAIELYPHQVKAVRELSNGRILCGGVGSGKSRTALAYFYSRVCGGGLRVNGEGHMTDLKTPMNLLIITTAQKRDILEWEGEMAPFALTECGIDIVVDSWNNIKKYKELKGWFIIFDEQRLVGSGVWVKTFLKMAKANKWILLSATPGDTWSDYIPVFVANGYYPNKTAFLREHVVYSRFTKYPKVDRYLGTKKLNRIRDEVLVHMPYPKKAQRIEHDVHMEYDSDLTKQVIKKRQNPYNDWEPIVNAGQLCYILRRIANSEEQRLMALVQIVMKVHRVIVFYNFDYELEILWKIRDILGESVEVKEWNGHNHDQLPSSSSWVYLVQYTAGSEGWNCITTDTVVFYSLNYSYRTMEQAKGRIDRLNSPYSTLHYYRFYSNSPIENGIRRALSAKKKFNERAFVKKLF